MATALLLCVSIIECGQATPGASPSDSDPVAEAKQTVAAFYGELEMGQFDKAADLIRTADGQEFSAQEREAISSSFGRAFGGTGGAGFHITQISYGSATKLSANLLSQANASDGYQLTVGIDGSSTNHCLPIPTRSLSARVAKFGTSWYLLQQIPSDYHLTCIR
jgi:hypothetical protein